MTTNTVAATPRVGRINSLASVKREISKIYRDVKAGNLALDEAKKLIECLGTIAANLGFAGKGPRENNKIAA